MDMTKLEPNTKTQPNPALLYFHSNKFPTLQITPPPLLLFRKHSSQLQFFVWRWSNILPTEEGLNPKRLVNQQLFDTLRGIWASYLLSTIPSIMHFLFPEPLRVVDDNYIILPPAAYVWVRFLLYSNNWRAIGWAKQGLVCI